MSERQPWTTHDAGVFTAPGSPWAGFRPGITLADAAREYAAAGLPVLPLHTPAGTACSCRRSDCTSPGKHPRLPRGLLQASTDADQVGAWWRRWPDANIGLRTGTVADVCDIDRPGQFTVVLGLLAGRPLGPVVRTGSGGWHLWWAPTGRGNRVRILDGVDWRGVGGYVVAPPSLHASGHRYEWLRPVEFPLPACPPRLLRLTANPRRSPAPDRPGIPVPDRAGAGAPAPVPGGPHGRIPRPRRAEATAWVRAAVEGEANRVAAAQPGERNDTLNVAAFRLGQLVGADLLDAGTARSALTTAAHHCGLPAHETARTIHSGLTAGRQHPRGPA
ncbi:bifunctional DNA primase/polymerase [Longispora sp. K20-0274]|uniref:bifunctional DNA primase/polymerase n=1 Tax=Longispora sp. K20-0274 TaxID=3088255 RepID=UPI00399C2250